MWARVAVAPPWVLWLVIAETQGGGPPPLYRWLRESE